MSIEFHCEHCNLMVKVPNEVGGRPGKCPHCQGVNYIPLPEDEIGEIPMEPLDKDFERHRRQAASEDFAFQRRIMSDKSMPGEGRRPVTRKGKNKPDGTPRPAAVPLTDRQVSSLVVSFIEAMTGGSLEKADEITAKLRAHPSKVNAVINDILNNNNAGAYGLPTIPKPVLNGFIKQLRARIS